MWEISSAVLFGWQRMGTRSTFAKYKRPSSVPVSSSRQRPSSPPPPSSAPSAILRISCMRCAVSSMICSASSRFSSGSASIACSKAARSKLRPHKPLTRALAHASSMVGASGKRHPLSRKTSKSARALLSGKTHLKAHRVIARRTGWVLLSRLHSLILTPRRHGPSASGSLRKMASQSGCIGDRSCPWTGWLSSIHPTSWPGRLAFASRHALQSVWMWSISSGGSKSSTKSPLVLKFAT
mmetsp:Transcript_4402/g.13233  ORF Transcript_4402/g.13233 Transcript_4402/m.13233 type:complete len:239 (-) Transcript_4402:360-1076(-)